MRSSPPGHVRLTLVAGLTAFVLLAGQVAGKAARDALFLSNFDVEQLPAMLVAASIVSVFVLLVATRALRQFGPRRALPGALVVSGTATWLIAWLQSISPQAASVGFFLVISASGAVTISTFWSLLTELFDPTTAKRDLPRIAIGAALGGVAGGMVAAQIGEWLGPDALLPLLGGLRLLAAVLAIWIAYVGPPSPRAQATATAPASPLAAIRGNALLRDLALLILTINIGAALLDYAFKTTATETYPDTQQLLSFFAIFYALSGLATFLLQLFVSGRAVGRWGIAGAVALHPILVIAGTVLALGVPGILAIAAARAIESGSKSSVFRSGYELFYTAVPVDEKRATKLWIDVGAERIGDVLGALVVAVLVALSPILFHSVLLGSAVAFAIALILARRLRGDYVQALTRTLEDNESKLDTYMSHQDTRNLLLTTLGNRGAEILGKVIARLEADTSLKAVVRRPLVSLPGQRYDFSSVGIVAKAPSPVEPKPPVPLDLDPVGTILLARESQGIIELGKAPERVSDRHVPMLIDLLAQDSLKQPIAMLLRKLAPRCGEELCAAINDPDQAFAVRRRLPAVLAEVDPELSCPALLRALRDGRFEVRYNAARVLLRLVKRGATIDESVIEGRISEELALGNTLRQRRRILEEGDEAGLRVGIHHLFTLLNLLHPNEPFSLALAALRGSDPHLSGTAMELLDSTLPKSISEPLQALLQASPLRRHP